jgi:hypothetical protein
MYASTDRRKQNPLIAHNLTDNSVMPSISYAIASAFPTSQSTVMAQTMANRFSNIFPSMKEFVEYNNGLASDRIRWHSTSGHLGLAFRTPTAYLQKNQPFQKYR